MIKTPNLHATRIFWENSLPHTCKKANYPFGCKGTDEQVIVNRGGGGSSKSHSLMQIAINKFLSERGKRIY